MNASLLSFPAGQVIEDRKAVGTALEQVYAQFAYTPNGKQLWVKDAKANQTTYLYDAFDRLSRTTFPDGTHEEMGYDVIGNVLTKRARNAQAMVNTYDALDRMLTHLTPQPGGALSLTTSFTYDLAGRPLTISDSAGNAITNSYDTAKRLIAVAQTFAGLSGARTIAYQYDAAGNRTRLTHPDGYYVQYAYDAMNRMTTAMENGSYVLATYLYDPLSRRTSLVTGNGAIQSYAYSSAGDLTSLGHTLTGAANVFTHTFTKAHPPTLSELRRTRQIASKSASNAAWAYTPPALGTTAYSPANALNQYVSVTPPSAAPVSIAYDANGNLTGDGTWTFAYDAENKLRTAVKSGTTATYAYDPLGRRQAKTVNGVSTALRLSSGRSPLKSPLPMAICRR